MMRISLFFTRISGFPALAASLALFIAAALLILPVLATLMGTISGNLVSPDTLPYYTGDTLYEMALAYGEQGRSGYIRSMLLLDTVWPLVYTAALCVSISFFGNIGFARKSWLKRINLTPLAAGFFDLLENLSVSAVMAAFPDVPIPLLHLAGLFTAAKWGAALVSILALAFAALRAGLSFARRQNP